jgi:hypothetical protein
MENENMIDLQQFCYHHNLQLSFMQSLQQFELIRLTTIDETSYIDEEQLPEVEKIARLYADLGINMEGIDAIRHLLHKIESMQNEISALKNRLKLYEDEENTDL